MSSFLKILFNRKIRTTFFIYCRVWILVQIPYKTCKVPFVRCSNHLRLPLCLLCCCWNHFLEPQIVYYMKSGLLISIFKFYYISRVYFRFGLIEIFKTEQWLIHSCNLSLRVVDWFNQCRAIYSAEIESQNKVLCGMLHKKIREFLIFWK